MPRRKDVYLIGFPRMGNVYYGINHQYNLNQWAQGHTLKEARKYLSAFKIEGAVIFKAVRTRFKKDRRGRK